MSKPSWKKLLYAAQETIHSFNLDHYRLEDTLLIKKLRAYPFTDMQIAAILKIVESTCRDCFDAEYPCHCENEE